MDETERKQLIAAVKEALGEKAAGLEGRLAQLEQILAERGANPGRALGNVNPYGDAFRQRMNALAEGALSTGRISMGLSLKGVKALVSGDATDSPSNTFPTQAQRGPIVQPAMRPLTLIDALQSIPVASNSYEHVRLSRTSNAGVQATEGAQKNETTIEAALVTTPIATVAHWTHASKQVLGDNPQLSTMLNVLLAYDVLAKFEDLLITGDSATPGEFDGIDKLATAIVTSKPHNADVISEAAAIMSNSGYVPSFVLMNALDWDRIQTERADAGDGQYVSGGWSRPAAPSIWTFPVVQSPAVTEGDAYLIDTSRVRVLDREQVTTMISTEDRDNFVKNLVTLLGEMRGGFACYDTGGIGKVTLPINSP